MSEKYVKKYSQKTIYNFILTKLFGWNIQLKCNIDNVGSAIVIVAPHTSFYDGFIGKIGLLTIGWKHLILSAPWLFKSPMLPIMKMINAIPIKGHNSIYNVANRLKENTGLKVIMCPEGHRAKVNKWNSGFFYMAKIANVPIIVVTLNYNTKTITFKDIITVDELSQYSAKTIMIAVKSMYNDSDTYAKYPEKFVLPNITKY